MATDTTTPATRSQRALDAEAPRPRVSAPSTRTALLVTALIGALAWNALKLDARPDDGALAASPLALPEPRCELPTEDPDELLARARQLASAARARIDRYPFRPAEGLPALAMLGEAAACTAQAGGDASALVARARALRERIETDYRDRVLRVEHALAVDEPRRARADIEALVVQLEGEDHAFARRMRNLHAALADGAGK